MLKLTLKEGQRIGIGAGIVVELCRVKGKRATIGVLAPQEDVILRESLMREADPAPEIACIPPESP
jgi:sRNA-binding carbon storage regulator CsrA